MACKNPEDKKGDEKAITNETISDSSDAGQWKFLFNGESAQGWRAYNGTADEGLPEGWVIQEGTLKSLGQGGFGR